MNKKLKIGEPCHEKWDEMTLVEQGRHCQVCAKKVVDFSNHTRTEIIDFLGEAEGQTCGRFKVGQIDICGGLDKPIRKTKIPFHKVAAASILAFLGVGVTGTNAQNLEHFEMGDVAYEPIEELETNNKKVVLKGRVLSVRKGSIENAKVTLYSGGKLINSVKTDSDGNYLFDLEKGVLINNKYTIKVFATGYESKTFVKMEARKAEMTMNITMDYELMLLGKVAYKPEIDETIEERPVEEPEATPVEFLKGEVCIIKAEPKEGQVVPQLEDTISEKPKVPIKKSILDVDIKKKNHKDEPEVLEDKEIEPIDSEFIMGDKHALIEMNVFPNPTKSKVFVKTSALGKYAYKVTNLIGSLLYEGTKQRNRFELDFSGQPNGVYLISLYSEGELLKTEKVVVSR